MDLRSPTATADLPNRLSKASSGTHVVIAANPRSGSTSSMIDVEAVSSRLNQLAGWSVAVETDPQKAEASIRRLSGSGELRCAVAAGGDGTASMVAGWLDSDTPMAVFPSGNENLLAKQWGISSDVDAFCAMLIGGRCVACDAGLANDRLFLLHATVGFDAEVVRLAHENRKGHIRHSSYVPPLLKSIRRYRYPVLHILTEGNSRPLRARWAFAFNFPAYAMGLPIAPDANPIDGELDLCTFRGGRLLNGLMYFFGVVLRRHRSWRDTHLERTTWLKIESDESVPYQVDGDPGGYLPLEISVVPSRFRLIVPADTSIPAIERALSVEASRNQQ